MTCSGQNSVKIKLSSPFESLVCKLESMSSQIKLNISVFFSFYFTSLFTLSQFHKQSNRHEETLVGLAPPNEAPTSPQIEIWNTVNQCFYHIFRMSSPLAQTYKRKAPYWRLSRDSSFHKSNPVATNIPPYPSIDPKKTQSKSIRPTATITICNNTLIHCNVTNALYCVLAPQWKSKSQLYLCVRWNPWSWETSITSLGDTVTREILHQ